MIFTLRPFLVLRPFCCLETWNEKQFCWTYESWLTYISSKLLLKLKAKRVHLFPFVIFFIHSWRRSTGNFNIIPGNLFSTLPQATMLSYFSPLKRIYILFTPVSNNKLFTCLQGVNFTKTPWDSSSSSLHLSSKDNVTYLSESFFFFFFGSGVVNDNTPLQISVYDLIFYCSITNHYKSFRHKAKTSLLWSYLFGYGVQLR